MADAEVRIEKAIEELGNTDNVNLVIQRISEGMDDKGGSAARHKAIGGDKEVPLRGH